MFIYCPEKYKYREAFFWQNPDKPPLRSMRTNVGAQIFLLRITKMIVMKVSDILQKKGNNVFSVSSQTTVYDALKSMSEKNIGALLVIDNDELEGIISERDYARKIILKGKTSHDTTVEEIMTDKEKVITVMPDDGLEKCMELMSKHHIRHLPVVKSNKVFGMVSIGDVVKAIIESQKETITHLQNYISQ